MTKTKIETFPFDELRRLLQGLGYKEKIADNAHIFHQARKNLLVFRRYDPQESVDWGDVVSTRKFLDMRGILEVNQFDSLLESKVRPA